MSKQRYISTSLWDDDWFVESLTRDEKLFYMYLLTNEQTNIAGIYKISQRKIKNETGFEKSEVEEIFKKLQESGKVYYFDGHVVMCNWPKHQNWENKSKIHIGIRSILSKEVPKSLIDSIYSGVIPYAYPIHTLSDGINSLQCAIDAIPIGYVYGSNLYEYNLNSNSTINSNSNLNLEDKKKKKEENNIPFVSDCIISSQTVLDKNQNAYDFNMSYWNSKNLPKTRYSSMNISNIGEVIDGCKLFSNDEIRKAIDNYEAILNDPAKYTVFPKYTDFKGFLKSGVEKFFDDGKPFERCENKVNQKYKDHNASTDDFTDRWEQMKVK